MLSEISPSQGVSAGEDEEALQMDGGDGSAAM